MDKLITADQTITTGEKIKLNLLIVSDLVLMRHALTALIRQSTEAEVIATANSSHELFQHLEKLKPDIILLDLTQTVNEGLEITKTIDERMPWIKVIILTLNSHPFFIKEMLKHGAKGFISKNSSLTDFFEGIRSVGHGKTFFCSECSKTLLREIMPGTSDNEMNFRLITAREIEIISFLAQGMTTKGIADKLFISQKTVERHKTNILGKLKLKNTAQLVRVATEHGLLFK